MTKFTKKKKYGGSNPPAPVNIFNFYDPSDIRTRLDNYVATAYALYQAAQILNSNVVSKTDLTSDNSTYVLQNNNAQMFAEATTKLNGLLQMFNNNFIAPSPSHSPYPSPSPSPSPLPSPSPSPLHSPSPSPLPLYSPYPSPSPSR